MRFRYCIAALATSLLLFGQATITPRATRPREGEPSPLPRANIRVDSNLVLVPITVLDPLGRLVTGLDADNFQVFEAGVQQKITSFGSEDAPLSLGILLDTSGSMGEYSKLATARDAVVEFFHDTNPEDEAFLAEFRDRPELTLPFTKNIGDIESKILFSKSKGTTALLDGVTLAVGEMRKATNPRKAVILLSDGGENNSRYTEAEVRNRVKESEVQIYTMAIGPGGGLQCGGGLLARLSNLTGGRCFRAFGTDLVDVAQKIGVELRNTYVIGYVPANKARDGKYRPIAVKVLPPRGMPKLAAEWRRGYYAPTQ